MKIIRKRHNNGKSEWKVQFNDKFLNKAKEKNIIYNPEETFIVDMRVVKDVPERFIKNVETGIEVKYNSSIIEEKNKFKVRFDFNDDHRLEYRFDKDFRSYATGAFYKFFDDIIKKTKIFSR